MRIHYLQHAPFEGPAAIASLAESAGHTVSSSRLDCGEALPDIDCFDLLVVLGGPMSVNDERLYPWIAAEKRLIQKAMKERRSLLGVCLGAQMIASAVGARVYRATEKEIGWFPVKRSTTQGLGSLFPPSFTPLHWHGDTFDLPSGAVLLAETDCVPDQAFQLGPNVVGLQFHLEVTGESVGALVSNAAGEIEPDKQFQQPPESILAQTPQASASLHPILARLLDCLDPARS